MPEHGRAGRGLGGWAARFLALLLVGAAAWVPLSGAFVGAYAAAANQALGLVTFGQRGRTRLQAGARDGSAAIAVRVDGHDGALALGVNVRRDAYVPFVLALAVVLAAPALPGRRRITHAAAAGLGALLFSVGLTFVAIAWFFADRLPAVWSPVGPARALLSFLNGALVLPPANRFAFSIGLGVALVLAARRRQSSPTVRPDASPAV